MATEKTDDNTPTGETIDDVLAQRSGEDDAGAGEGAAL